MLQVVRGLLWGFCQFLASLFESRHLIFQLSKRDFKSNYLGSYLSIVWAFIHPAVTILTLWFVFQVGFNSPPVDGCPFILWLITGMIPWFFFSDSLATATNSIQGYSFLVKKVVFRVSVLPVVKILSALLIHVFFLLIIVAAFLLYGYGLSVHVLQVPYFVLSAVVLLLGMSWITSAFSVFVRDVVQVVNILLQFGFWLTPLVWNIKMMPEKYHFIMKLNPVYYITEGFRMSFIYHEWFWAHMEWTLYFWGLTAMIFAAGAVIFLKLRPHFADVL